MTTREGPVRRQVEGLDVMHKFGESRIDNKTADLWDLGNSTPTYPWPTTGGTVFISSTSPQDSASGSGLRTVEIAGVETGSFRYITETIVLAGTTEVGSTKSYFRVFRVTGQTAGASEKAAGHIRARLNGTTIAQVMQGNTSTFMCIQTIPAGREGLLRQWNVSVDPQTTKDVRAVLGYRPFGGVFIDQSPLRVRDGVSVRAYPPEAPLSIREKSDVRVRVTTNENNALVTVQWDMELVQISTT